MRRYVLMTAAVAASLSLATRASALTMTEQPTTMIETHRSGSIEYITGGIGEQELAAIRSMGSNYNLKVVTAMPDGAYLNNVDLTVADARGTPILNATTQGPLFYAKLPPGRYNIIVRVNGQTVEKAVTAGSTPVPEVSLTMNAPTTAARPVYSGGYASNRDPRPTPEEKQGFVSLYNLDPYAANAKAQVNMYEVYPDGTARPVTPSAAGAPPSSEETNSVTIHIEPVPEPGAALPEPPVVVSPDGQL